MATTIKLKNSVTTTNAPSSLVQGEVAINITDKKVWVGNAATTPVQLLGDGGSASFTSIAFGAGTVSNPSITFTGDTNTGIYSPAADTIAFTEGGVESMRIDSSGNVGMGRAPLYQLDVYRSGTQSPAIASANDNIVTILQSVGSSQGNVGTITSHPLCLFSGNLERMRITSSGDVGIGTSSPSAKVQIFKNAVGASGSTVTAANTALALQYDSSTVYGYHYMNADGVYFIDARTNGVAGGNICLWGQNSVLFRTAGVDSDAARMIINSSGNVGIGTISPSSRLSVTGSANIATFDGGTNTSITLTGSGRSDIFLIDSGAATDQKRLTIRGNDGNFVFGVENDAVTTFTERMRITSGGDLLVGSTSQLVSERLRVVGSSTNVISVHENTNANPKGLYSYYSNAAPNGAGNEFLQCNDNAALRMSVRSNGGIANYSANDVNLSDEKEKTNIQLASSYLNKICAIPVKTFNYIDQNRETDDGLTLGVIAQDVQVVAPELVNESNWGTEDEPKMRLSIYQTDLQYALMKCIQEQQAMIEELKQEVAALKAK